MVMVATNLQQHNMYQPQKDIVGLPHITPSSVDPGDSSPHHPDVLQIHIPGPAPSSKTIAQPVQKRPQETTLTPILRSQTPNTSRDESVGDGSNLTTLGECPIQPHSSSPPSSGVDKPLIDCVVSNIMITFLVTEQKLNFANK